MNWVEAIGKSEVKKLAISFCILGTVALSACGLLVEEGGEPLAEVAGELIRARDLQEEIRHLPFEERAKANDVAEDVRVEVRRKALNKMVVRKMLLLEAEDLGIDVSEEEIEAALASERSGPGAAGGAGEDSQGEASKGHGHEGEAHTDREVEEMREELIAEKVMATKTSDDVLRQTYEERISDFAFESPLVTYEMVVVDLKDIEVLDALYEEVSQGGRPLQEAVKDPRYLRKIVFAGPAASFRLDMVEPSLRENLEDLREGDFSKPFHLQQGSDNKYCFVRLVRYLDVQPYKLAKNSLYIRARMVLLLRLRKKFGVKDFSENLNYAVGD